MNAMRLLADVLTGALDTAAGFVRLSGPISVYWPDVIPTELPQSAALDTATRELGRAEATAVLDRLSPTLASGALAFKKIDSPLHRERHRDTGKRVLLDAAALGVAEEHHDGVTHVLVDRRAVLEGDFRHL